MINVVLLLSESYQDQLLPVDLRRNLFFMFSSWCAHFGVKAPGVDK
jgi:hypothetical protein